VRIKAKPECRMKHGDERVAIHSICSHVHDRSRVVIQEQPHHAAAPLMEISLSIQDPRLSGIKFLAINARPAVGKLICA
ncbi:hypothetical protein, partial [Pseudomonas viridiflava]|uniref:hypothetical protein n=1 Tax=Pseudomonas viridiflava TaxID=33069 RepID=UPI0019D24F25